MTPNPPSFNKIAANTIEPTTGASTWALGNHRWKGNIGNFTRNPITRIREKIFDSVGEIALRLLVTKDGLILFSIKTKKIKRGKEAEMVYMTIKRLAKIRSGWPPQPKIIIIIGISLTSKAMYRQIREFLLKNITKIKFNLKIITSINLKENCTLDFPMENTIRIEIKMVRAISAEDIKSKLLFHIEIIIELSEENNKKMLFKNKKRHTLRIISGTISGKKRKLISSIV